MGDPVRLGVEQGFRRWAEVYDSDPNPLLALEQRLLIPLLPRLEAGFAIDLGCGTGRWLRRLSLLGASQVVGIDITPAMLRRARANTAAARLICGTCDRLPLAAACGGLVLCSFTVGYLAKLDSFAAELFRIARPGADIFLSDLHPSAHSRGWRRAFRSGDQRIEVRAAVRPLAELFRALRQAGLEQVALVETPLGEPERRVFGEAGKEHLFAAAAQGPAIFIAHFRRPARRSYPSPSAHRPVEHFTLAGARVALNAGAAVLADVHVEGGRIAYAPTRAASVNLTGHMLLPGLINAHDHLELNLFPRLGNGGYRNFQEWATDIYRPALSPVREHRAIDKRTRLFWGGLKNLLSGVTTVAHHNPYQADVFGDGFPVRVLRRYGWAHSLALAPDLKAAFDATPPGAPFIIHLAEGTDGRSQSEIHDLDRRGMLTSQTAIVHGVALGDAGRKLLRERAGALIWCPTSNLFTLGRTLSAGELAACGRTALATDSALSGAGNLLDEIRYAHRAGIPPSILYEMVTAGAADVLRLEHGEGALSPGAVADILGIRDNGRSPAEALAELTEDAIEFVILGGRIAMISPELARLWPLPLPSSMQEISVAGVRRLVSVPVGQLLDAARRHIGPDVRLAGKLVTQ